MIVFSNFNVREPFHREGFKWGKYGSTGLISVKTEAFYAEINERAEAATSSYSATDDFLQCIYFVAKNHQMTLSRCLVYEFSFRDIS